MSHHSGASAIASNRVVTGRGSTFPMQSRHGRGEPESNSHISCNRCRKSLSTTIFVCACDCVFCEGKYILLSSRTIYIPLIFLHILNVECTYSHFNNSSTCPVCQKTLGTKDFMELVVADPSSATEETLKNTFQTIFTKYSLSSNVLGYQEMCSRLMKSFDDDRRAVRFLLKQFVLESKSAGRQSGSIERAFEDLKAEYTNMKQATSSQRIQTDQIIADLRHRVQALTGTVQEQQKKIDEKDTQINQFRRMCSSDSVGRIPGSSHSGGSGSGQNNVRRSHDHSNSPAPPMPGFVMRKHAEEHAKEKALYEITRSRGPPNMAVEGGNGRQSYGKYTERSSETDSVITPIQVPPPNYYAQGRRMSPSVVPNTPRIRDLSAGSSYVFTSSNSRNALKRPRHDAPTSSYVSPVLMNKSGYGQTGERRSIGVFSSR